jgi:hypothetical protein
VRRRPSQWPSRQRVSGVRNRPSSPSPSLRPPWCASVLDGDKMLSGLSAYLARMDIPPEVRDGGVERKATYKSPVQFEQQSERAVRSPPTHPCPVLMPPQGLLCTEELKSATERCHKKVEAIIKDCRCASVRYQLGHHSRHPGHATAASAISSLTSRKTRRAVCTGWTFQTRSARTISSPRRTCCGSPRSSTRYVPFLA